MHMADMMDDTPAKKRPLGGAPSGKVNAMTHAAHTPPSCFQATKPGHTAILPPCSNATCQTLMINALRKPLYAVSDCTGLLIWTM